MIRVLLYGIVGILVAYALAVNLLPWAMRRKLRHVATIGVCALGAVLALVPLVLLVSYLFRAGAPGIGLTFLTQSQHPLGEAGSGMLHALVGSLIIVVLASLVGVPVGIGAGIYLSEFGRGRFASAVRLLADVMTGLPSIIAGILAYELIVVKTGSFSGFAGAIALSVLMIPVITRVTEESLRLVPSALREASFGLGVGSARTVWHIVLPSARSGILTGVILAVARVGGETAPLLFTTAGQSVVSWNPMKAMAALPLSIYLNSGQPFDSSRQLAITGALFLVVLIGAVNISARWLASKSQVA